MSRLTGRIISLALVALLVAASAGPALGLVLKHRTTGEVLRGTLTKEREGRLYGFRTEDGAMRWIDPKKWQLVKVEKGDKGGDTDAEGTPEEKEKDEPVLAHIVPIVGAIDKFALVSGIEKALEEARDAGAKVVVFRIDTPGGRIDLGNRMIRMIGDIDWAKTVAWVQGGDKQALSCGAYLCLSTHEIYMAPGTTIGAATPYRLTMTGSAQVDEKMTSAFRARFRSLAQERGHPSAIADAMVDASNSVVQVWVDGEQRLVSAEEAERLEEEHKDSDRFKRGKTVSKAGKLVTLTSNEALEFGVCAGIVESAEELLEKMGYSKHEVVDAEWLPKWVEEEAEQAKNTVEKYRTAFNAHMQQAIDNDPRMQRYVIGDSYGTFVDGGRRWRAYTDRCIGHLKHCAQALKQLEKLIEDERYEFHVPQEFINDMKAQMETFYARLGRERNSRRLP